MTYRVVGTESDESFSVQESRFLADGAGHDLWSKSADSTLAGGEYRSKQSYQIPSEAQEGTYFYRAELKAGPTAKTTDPTPLKVTTSPE